MVSANDPHAPLGRDILLQEIKVAIGRRVADEQLRTLNIAAYRDHFADATVVQLRRKVAAEELPPTSYLVVLQDPRWATWWDFFKATYRDRWWLAWLVRRHPARTIDVAVRGTVNVRSWWTYPDTPHLVPPGLGYSILKTTTTTAQYDP